MNTEGFSDLSKMALDNERIHLKEDHEILDILKALSESSIKLTSQTLTLSNTNSQLNHITLRQRILKLIDQVESIKEGNRFVNDTCSLRKIELTARILSRIHELSFQNKHIFKGSFYYHNLDICQERSECDDVLDDICCMLGCTLTCLKILDDVDNGVVMGRLKYRDYDHGGDLIDCTKLGIRGTKIPLDMNRVGDISSDALFILLVEKESGYLRLVDDRFYNRFPCILVTVAIDEIPSVGTKLFLRMLKLELNLHVFALLNCDPKSLEMLCAYGHESKMNIFSYDGVGPDIKWLGIRPSDLDKFKIPQGNRLEMSKEEIKACKDLLKNDFVKKNPGWVKELKLMVKMKQKVEVEALSYFGIRYLSEAFVPLKLQQQDWL